jgi:uncharacterized membrane protein YsdA (DUF1294 family)
MSKTVRTTSQRDKSVRGRKPYGNAYRRYGLGFGLLALLLFLPLAWVQVIPSLIICWVIAISLTAFIAFGFDKLSAISRWLRVPETVLIGLAFVGGTIGALLAMGLFRHKTAKRSFQWRFWLAVGLQATLVVAYYVLASRV